MDTDFNNCEKSFQWLDGALTGYVHCYETVENDCWSNACCQYQCNDIWKWSMNMQGWSNSKRLKYPNL